jgi:hypothetical protein
LFEATAQALEKAIIAMLAAETITGRGGAGSWPLDRHPLHEVMRRFGRLDA